MKIFPEDKIKLLRYLRGSYKHPERTDFVIYSDELIKSLDSVLAGTSELFVDEEIFSILEENGKVEYAYISDEELEKIMYQFLIDEFPQVLSDFQNMLSNSTIYYDYEDKNGRNKRLNHYIRENHSDEVLDVLSCFSFGEYSYIGDEMIAKRTNTICQVFTVMHEFFHRYLNHPYGDVFTVYVEYKLFNFILKSFPQYIWDVYSYVFGDRCKKLLTDYRSLYVFIGTMNRVLGRKGKVQISDEEYESKFQELTDCIETGDEIFDLSSLPYLLGNLIGLHHFVSGEISQQHLYEFRSMFLSSDGFMPILSKLLPNLKPSILIDVYESVRDIYINKF